MSRYAKIGKNDIVNGKGVSVSFWAQGCPHRCPGCHNPETWDFKEGKEFSESVVDEVLQAISANGIVRNLSILGGEPLAPANLAMIESLISAVKRKFPQIEISMWTGYSYEELSKNQVELVNMVDYLIDGEFDQKLRDITIGYAGSSNQKMIDVKATKEFQEIKTLDNF
ncbi:MAG: anaerobic ribonucleoside-triphosphate reductase activating protein [Cellulosilyticaceae bacterium]